MEVKIRPNRILPLDGLRTIAVLGVIWKHIWGILGNIPFYIFKIDINKVFSILGNGVDLFFVISGFCMYYMYLSGNNTLSLDYYLKFLRKRWLRIAPAFYVALIVETILFMLQHNRFPLNSFVYHIFFINVFLSLNEFAPHYWSLSTEWQFYIILPFFFTSTNQKSIFRIFILFLILSITFRLLLFHLNSDALLNKITVNSDAIWYRFPEFGFGMIAAKLYSEDYLLPSIFRNWRGFILGLIVAYIGRIFMLTEFINYFGHYNFILRSLGEPIMTFGFMLILYNLITFDYSLSRFFSNKLMLFIGKISYSMYLWHYVIISFVTTYIVNHFGNSSFNLYLSFILSVFLIIPISWVSYRLFEYPYFKKG